MVSEQVSFWFKYAWIQKARKTLLAVNHLCDIWESNYKRSWIRTLLWNSILNVSKLTEWTCLIHVSACQKHGGTRFSKILKNFEWNFKVSCNSNKMFYKKICFAKISKSGVSILHHEKKCKQADIARKMSTLGPPIRYSFKNLSKFDGNTFMCGKIRSAGSFKWKNWWN